MIYKSGNNRLILILSLFFLLFLGFFSIHAIADYPITTEVSISPNSIEIEPEESFTFNVTCAPIQNVKSFELKLRFDADFIQIDSVVEGDFFDGFTTFFNDGTINNNAGTVKGIYNLIVGSGNVSSNATLIEVSGTALSNFGFVDIELYEVGITNESSYIPISINQGTVVIQDFISIFSPNPQNQSDNVDVSLDTLSIDITQMTGDQFNYSIITIPDIGSTSASYQNNGTKSFSISNLEYDTSYDWFVSVKDINSGQWMNRSFEFSTESYSADDVIDISAPNPSNRSSAVSIDKSSISVAIEQSEGGLFDFSISTSPDIGSLSASSVSSGTKTCSISNLDYDTTYTWTVSVKDLTTGGWVNRSYWFTIESEPDEDNDDDGPGGGFPSGGGGGFLPPPPVENQNNAPYKPVRPSGPLYIEPGGSFSYSAQTYDPDGDQIRYRFDWGDGNLSEWTNYVAGNQSVSLSHSWYQIANFSVMVIAQDEQGLNSSWSQGLLVYCSFADDGFDEKDPVAIFEPVQNDSDDFTFRFNSTMSYDEDGNITSYLWDFGDGFTSTEKNPDHTYASPGWYNVTLLITDDDGNVYSKTMNVFIQSESTTNTAETKNQSFPWMMLFYIGAGALVCVVIIFRKQLFSLFFEYVEVDEDGNPIDESIESEGTFVDQIKDVDRNLNPFDRQPGNHKDIPLGVSAELPKYDSEKDEEKHVRHHRKHRDIHFIRNLIDDHFSDDDEED